MIIFTSIRLVFSIADTMFEDDFENPESEGDREEGEPEYVHPIRTSLSITKVSSLMKKYL